MVRAGLWLHCDWQWLRILIVFSAHRALDFNESIWADKEQPEQKIRRMVPSDGDNTALG